MHEHELSAFLKRHIKLFRAIFLIADLALLNIAYQGGLFLRFSDFIWLNPDRLQGAPPEIYTSLALYMSLAWIVLSLSMQLYVGRRGHPRHEEVRDVIKVLGLLATSILLYIVAQGGYNFYSRAFLLYFFLLATVELIGFRMILRTSLEVMREKGINSKDILIIGAGKAGEKFYNAVKNNPGYGYNVIGFLDDNGVNSKVKPLILGKLADLHDLSEAHEIDEVVIALPKATEETIAGLVTECESKCIRVNVIPNDYAAFEGKRVIEQIGEFSLVRMREAPLDFPVRRLAKRAFDVSFSLLVLTLVFPWVYAISAALIKLTSRGPVFFKQLRTGEDNQTFVCYKFRTMKNLPRAIADSQQAVPNDPRLTWIGKLLRRTNLDELPQFWNVLKGEMSVVGPRPHMLKHTEQYSEIIEQYMVRHFVKPGLTGWAQVNGFRGATKNPEQMERRIEHDLYYIENWSFLLDLAIIGKTLQTMIKGDENAY
ncbi:MAG TPA: undecaprenyl-phosphate glucose phosphotransferase [Candidatus Kapabacteria bacterium]|nr:undecaprenyl-phosphate glucose phosphotransferase [Candidatus Kapabacteria bacterium]